MIDEQADLLVRLINRLLPHELCLQIAADLNVSPGHVRESFAAKITTYANNGDPKPVIDRFKYDLLPYIAVSVDMLDTGYDHEGLETLVMLRPTVSAMKYAQMRGRGSRLCPKIGKTEFWIYDFVGNVARFKRRERGLPQSARGSGRRRREAFGSRAVAANGWSFPKARRKTPSPGAKPSSSAPKDWRWIACVPGRLDGPGRRAS